TGTRWPADFAPDLVLDRGEGLDPKLAWELHRLQHAQVLALGGLVLDDARATQAAIDVIGSWVGSATPFHGVAWVGGIECALRVASLLVVVGLVGPEAIPPTLAADLWRAHHALGAWI